MGRDLDMSLEHSPAAAGECRIRQAGAADIPALAGLFDRYRQFYQQPADPEGAERYLSERFAAAESVVFIAEGGDGEPLGFTQLYPALCSVAMRRYWVLYDLFFVAAARRRGIARALMERARLHGLQTGAARIDLETAIDNLPGQALYESLGYLRETAFHKYSLAL
ncbi:MAG: N-acetyltransferase family protein [Gammaproteobacteria bacterium]